MRVSDTDSVGPELRSMYIRAARELFYDEQCIKELKNAKTRGEFPGIMRRARRRVSENDEH